MPYVPGCQYDLFISYACENNRDSWVEQFEKALGQELAELLGRQFSPKESIYFDRRDIEVCQSVPETLTRASRDSAILVPILSPGYLTSQWCDRERTDFFSGLPHGADPADCLAPIVVRPFDEKGLNRVYRDAHRRSFLSDDQQTPLAVGAPAWTTSLREFAGQIRNALERLRHKSRPIFLGRGPEPLRGWLCAEMERRCFRIVPEYLQSLENPETVMAHLHEAALAIHFLGAADEATLKAVETSICVCTGPTILHQRFGTNLTADEQLWLHDFERELQVPSGRYQRLTGKNDQELMSLIDELITQFKPASESALSDAEVGLICEELDIVGVRQLKHDIAARHSASVEYPEFLESRLTAMDRLRRWTEYLRRTQAHLFYYGEAEHDRLDLIWRKSQQSRVDAQREWFLAPPDIDRKREQYPDALQNIDEVVQFLSKPRGTQR